jgi:trehalose 6-phosphate synthase
VEVADERGVPARGPEKAEFVIVSDRLPGPVADHDPRTGATRLADDPVTAALSAACTRRAGHWVGRRPPGGPTQWRGTQVVDLGVDVAGYESHAGSTLWPIYHDLVRVAGHDRQWRDAFRRASQAFARAAASRACPGATVWVHDYHLHLVPRLLRRARPDLRIGCYLTTPFPSPDLLRQTPMSAELVSGLCGADLVGFQSAQSAENFLRLRADLVASPADVDGHASEVQVGVYPTSVDSHRIEALARRPAVLRRAAEIRASLGDPAVVLLSIDSPTAASGIRHRLRGLGAMLAGGLLDPDRVAIVQVVTGGADDPSDIAARAAGEAARINGQFASVGRPCVHFVRQVPMLEELVALYQAADVLLATPLREGATTAALEFAAVAVPDSAIVLSEFSGTAAVLPEAFPVNPYDEDRFRVALLAAIASGPDDRRRRMDAMHAYVTSYDTHAWARLFLSGLRRPDDASVVRSGRQWPANAVRSTAARDV